MAAAFLQNDVSDTWVFLASIVPCCYIDPLQVSLKSSPRFPWATSSACSSGWCPLHCYLGMPDCRWVGTGKSKNVTCQSEPAFCCHILQISGPAAVFKASSFVMWFYCIVKLARLTFSCAILCFFLYDPCSEKNVDACVHQIT